MGLTLFPVICISKIPSKTLETFFSKAQASSKKTDHALLLVSSDAKPVSSAPSPTQSPMPQDAVTPFEQLPTLEIASTCSSIHDSVSDRVLIILDAQTAESHQRCIIKQKVEANFEDVIVAFEAAFDVAHVLAHKSVKIWDLRNAAALDGGILSAQSARTVTTQVNGGFLAMSKQETKLLEEVPAQAKGDVSKQCFPRDFRTVPLFKEKGPLVRIVDSTSLPDIETSPSTKVTDSLDYPFKAASVSYIDAFVKHHFPGSKLNHERYLIMDKYTSDGRDADPKGGKSCIVVDNTSQNMDNFNGEQGIRLLRINWEQAYQTAWVMDENDPTLEELAQEAHGKLGIAL